MPSEYSYGPDSQAKVQQLLEVLLDGVDGTDVKLDARWDEQATALLGVETTLEVLRVLLHGNQSVPDERVKENQRKEIGGCLTHYLGKFLGIWHDRRVKKRGSSRWIFSLQLWSRDKDENLRQFRELWRKRQPENSPSCDTAIFETPNQSTKTVALERIPEVPVWVGRDDLIEELKAKILAPETSPKVLALIGQGGIGKTSLAVKLLESLGVNLQPPSLTVGCVYDSALYFKVSQGSSFDDVAAFLLGELGVEVAETLKTAEAKIAKILAALTEKRCLLVLDNLEDILYPASHPEAGKAISPEWGELLHSFAHSRHCSTLIITSRELPLDLADRRTRNPKPNPKLVKVCPVGGVADADGVEILRQNDSQDCEADLEWIAERVKGNALILTLLGRFGAETPGYLRKHPELVTEEAELIIRTQLERQSEAAQELLKRMCVLRVGIDVQGLTFLRLYEPEQKDERFEEAIQLGKPVEFTKAEIKETEEIIKRLANSSLVQRRYDKERFEYFYDLHRLIVEFLQAEYKAELPQLLERVYKLYCTFKRTDNPKILEDLYPVLEAQYFAFATQKYSESYDLLKKHLKAPLKLWGKWNLIKNICKQLLLYVNEEQNIYCLLLIGEIERDLRNLPEAESNFQAALDKAKQQKYETLIFQAESGLGDTYYLQGNWNKAKNIYLDIINRLEDLDILNRLEYFKEAFEFDIGSCYGQLGNVERELGNLEMAENLYKKYLDYMIYRKNLSGIALAYGCLGDIKYDHEDWNEAKTLYRKSLQLRRELGDRSGIAISYASLGDVEKQKRHFKNAKYCYQLCLDITTKLGDRYGVAMAIGCLGGLELSQGNLDVAENLLNESLSKLQEFGELRTITEVNYDLAQLWRKRGNAEKAQEHYTTAHRLYQQMGAAKKLEQIEREWNSPD